MPKSSNQKLKLIYLMKILLERTDETHSITMPEIIEALAAYDISAERKSLYNDIENLRVYGLDVIGTQEDRYRKERKVKELNGLLANMVHWTIRIC